MDIYRFLIDCVTSSLFGGESDVRRFEQLSPEERESLFLFAAEQGVISPLVAALSQEDVQIEMTDEALYSWFGLVLQIENDYCRRIETMKKLAKLFSKDGLDVMFIKGATLAGYYPCPYWRPWGDIDYYVYGKSSDSIYALNSIGARTREYYHHHTQSSLNGILIENHYDFFDRLNHKCNHLLDDELKSLAKSEGKTCPYIFEDDPSITNSYQMPPTMNAVFLMRHMSAHFVSESISLRMLYDWALFLMNEGDKVNWELVSNLYAQSGMMRFAKIVTSLLKDNLMLNLYGKCPIIPEEGEMPDRVWRSIINHEVRNPFRQYSIRYLVREVSMFIVNGWKHALVYPDESYVKLFFIYSSSHIKRMLGWLHTK